MKLFAIIGVVLLVAFHQINAQPTASREATSFSDDVVNITNSMLEHYNEPNNMETLAVKISGFVQASHKHNIDFQIYGSIYDILNNLGYTAPRIATLERALEVITRMQNNFDGQFDALNVERDADASLMPSEINRLIDEFINRYTETLVELFDNMYTQTKNLQVETEKHAATLIELIDQLVKNVQNCLELPSTEFKNIFECRENTRKTMLPGLAHENAMIQIIANELASLPGLKMDGKKSVFEVEWEIRREKKTLMSQIMEERDKREAAKESSTESSENEKY